MSAQLVRDISEFDLINQLETVLPSSVRTAPNIILGIGDDAAVATINPGQNLVITTDTLNSGVHFRLDWTTWRDLGYKALAVNLSDLAAMGATPVMATFSLSLSGDERVDDLLDLYRGAGQCAESGRVVIAGGDITRTESDLSITVTALGETRGGRYMTRRAAIPGDSIWVTGEIGAAAAGLELLLMPDDDPRKHAATSDILRSALHLPVARVSAGRTLAAFGVRCCMDLSDGLTADLTKILVASNVDAEINLADLPIPAAMTALFRDEALDLALSGGEDYELLFTAPDWLSAQISEGLELIGVRATVIGSILPRLGPQPRIIGVQRHGARSILRPGGFDHFHGQ
jgi:thiamine-monophosphate kinase